MARFKPVNMFSNIRAIFETRKYTLNLYTWTLPLGEDKVGSGLKLNKLVIQNLREFVIFRPKCRKALLIEFKKAFSLLLST